MEEQCAVQRDTQQDSATSDDEDTDDEYDTEMYGMHQALPIPDGEPDWESGEPDTAEEYLRRVRWEAARVPKVVTAAIDASAFTSHQTSYLPSVAAVPEAPAWAHVDQQWVKRFVLEFQQLRQYLALAPGSDYHGAAAAAPVPHQKDHQGWDRLCFGREMLRAVAQPGGGDGGGAASSLPAAAGGSTEAGASTAQGGSADEVEAEEELGVPGPMMHIITRLDQVAVVSLLLRHIEQLDGTMLTLLRSQWLFALTARLDKPVHAETAAALRQLLRRCCQLRAGLQQYDDPTFPLLNILIAISGAYFCQDEHFAGLIQCDLY